MIEEVDIKYPDKRARLRRLTWAFAGHISPKDAFLHAMNPFIIKFRQIMTPFISIHWSQNE